MPAKASFEDGYVRYFEARINGDEATELGELEAAMAHYQEAMNMLEDLSRRFPGQDVTLVMNKRAEMRDLIHGLRRLGVRDPQQAVPAPPPPDAGQPALPQQWQQRLDRLQQQLNQERLRVQDLQRRMRQQQQAHTFAMTQEQERRNNLQAEVLRNRDLAIQEREKGQNATNSLKARIEDLETQLADANQRLVDSQARNQELLASLEQAQGQIARLEEAQEELLAEKEKLQERLRLAATEEGIELLVQENQRLQADFSELQEKYEKLQQEAEVDNLEAVELKLLVADLQEQVRLSSVTNEELAQRLEIMETRLATAIEERNAATSEVDVASAEGEIRILRSALARQKGDHAHRLRIRETILAQLKKMDQGGAEIRQFLDQMVSQELDADEHRDQLVERMLSGTIVSDAAQRPTAQSLVLAAGEAEGIEDLSKIAQKQFTEGNFERALHNYETILRSVPNDVPTLISRGVVLLHMERSGDAEASLKKALAQRRDDSYARTMLALALLEQDRTERAVEELELAIEFNPTDATAHFYRGLIAHREMDFALAEEKYLEALSLQPKFATAHFNLASLLSKMSPVNRERIKHHYTEAVKFNAPRDLHIENVLAGNV